MKTSAKGRALIEAFEGLFLSTYKDSAGVLTIGYGHTSAAGGPKVYDGQRITQQEADKLLADDLGRVEKEVSKFIKVPLEQYEFDALVSFHFNTGKLGSGTVATKINAGDKQGAMATLLQYVNAGGKALRGLARRRQAEKLMFEGKVDEAIRLSGAKSIPAEHGTAGAIILTGGTAISQTTPDYWPYIIVGTAVAVIFSYIGFRIYKTYKERNNVTVD